MPRVFVTRLDRYEPAPPEGWLGRMQRQVEKADFVVLVCTATSGRRFEGKEQPGKGRGATWAGMLAQQVLREGGTVNRKFVPVWFEGAPDAVVPLAQRACTGHRLDGEHDALSRRLTG